MQVVPLDKMPVEAKIRHLWHEKGDLALSIARAENSAHICDLEVSEPNGSKSYGIFMINSIHLKKGYSVTQLKDCTQNVLIAYKIYKQQGGFRAWSAYLNGSYKKYE